MSHVLVATDSVHTTAAAADYLETRVGPDDRVTVLAVAEPGADRDAGDALNVAGVRLGALTDLETVTRSGPVAEAILAAVAERSVDELVIGARAGHPEAEPGLGGTARAILAAAPVPVVVLPVGGGAAAGGME